MSKIFNDKFENTATIAEITHKPYSTATHTEKGYVLTLYANYDNNRIYFVSIYESESEALKKLSTFSCGTFKED